MVRSTLARLPIWSKVVLGLVVVLAGAILLMALLGPSAHDAAAAAARSRCDSHGWPPRVQAGRYRDTSSGLTLGYQQEFQIDGTQPRMALWVEVRRPLYAPLWRVAEIVEVEADVDAD
jgi:hypothetical protein